MSGIDRPPGSSMPISSSVSAIDLLPKIVALPYVLSVLEAEHRHGFMKEMTHIIVQNDSLRNHSCHTGDSYQENNIPDRFVAYSEDDSGGVSLIVDDVTFQEIHPPEQRHGSVLILPSKYRAIALPVASNTLLETGIVCIFTKPLRQSHIHALQLSTWESELILVEEEYLEDALECVNKELRRLQQSKTDVTYEVLEEKKPALHASSIEEVTVSIVGMLTSDTSLIASLLLKALFFPSLLLESSSSRLISYIQVNDRCTLYIPVNEDSGQPCVRFPDNVVSSLPATTVMSAHSCPSINDHHLPWIPFQLSGGPGGCVEVGAISYLSDILAKSGVPVLHLSTGNNDFFLVPITDKNRVRQCMKQYQFS